MSTTFRVATRMSANPEEARFAVKALYRMICRTTPAILKSYEIEDVSPEVARKNLATLFRQNRHIKDIAVIDQMRFKGTLELSEALAKYKTNPQVYKLIEEQHYLAKKPSQSDFLEEFYNTQ